MAGWMDLQYTSQRAHPKKSGHIGCGGEKREEKNGKKGKEEIVGLISKQEDTKKS